jgi:DNA-binding CsgD family transcriptional regulator
MITILNQENKMISQHEKKALSIIANGHSINDCAEMMGVSRSRVEKLLYAAKINLNAKTLCNAIYRATRQGMIILCCVLIMNATELRRTARSGRREQEAIVIIV